jgi:predicted DsbA family dithiol-disulfide isomerase/uncharacterized membrane protein
LAWCGLWICLLLLQHEWIGHSFLCPAQGGCEAILGSRFADIRGIPLPWIGATFYLVLLILWLAAYATPPCRGRVFLLDAILWAVIAGATFSVGLMVVQFGLLHAFCPLCTASAGVVLVLLPAAVRARSMGASENAGSSPGGALSLGFFAVLPLAFFFLSASVGNPSPKGLWLADLSKAHRLGPADAPVQLVVYSDFQCGFCRQLAPVLHRVHSEFPQDVAIVFRNFPLDVHPRAFPAAVAAECAGEQGAFWEYHDKLFAEGGDLEEGRLIALAASLGLDQARFTACLRSAPPRQQVEADLREATALDLPGAPAVFLNGRRVDGPLNYEQLLQRIQTLLHNRPVGKGA